MRLVQSMLLVMLPVSGCGLPVGRDTGDGGPAIRSVPVNMVAAAVDLACSDQNIRQIAYFDADSTFKHCTTNGWKVVDLRGPRGETGSPGETSADVTLLVASESEPAGSNCFYGGANYALGYDVDSDGSLDAEEIRGTFYTCESSIDYLSRAIFDSWVYSIGVVEATYTYAGTCHGEAGPHQSRYTGTGWAYSVDTFVTNEHVVEKASSEDCDDDGNPDTDFALESLSLYLPRQSIGLDTLRSMGTANSPSWDLSGNEFDIFEVTQVDRRASSDPDPEAPGDRTDAAFLRVSGHGRTPLNLSAGSQSSPSGSSLRIGEQLVLFGHPLGQSSTVSVGELMNLQTCREWWQTYASDGTDTEFCADYMMVPDSLTMTVGNYADGGASGSPAFNRFGEVIGILTWGSNASDYYDNNSLQPVEYVRPWLQMPRIWVGITD